ncbi:hypothetical protein [Amycolatopsis thermophila]|uniref:Uncharacterized protein n=1 Tax=Amycolatopsis thermophila TaxID=206084 RepID=A0ABU0EML3_9PSEU|nr:hypothetical protein [Amycolatopsis thermophila]MDQ0376531.1 hypothetical protein [Amycolatopsis thermophila]
MTSLATKTPAEIDTEIARVTAAIYAHHAKAEQTQREKARAIEHMNAGAQFVTPDTLARQRENIAELQHRIDRAYDDAAQLSARDLRPLLDEFDRRGGWTRYYLVDNTNGHLHTTQRCRNTYASTQWYWVTELSGATAAEAVDAAGSLSCLTCFPDQRAIIESGRPSRIQSPNQRKTREEREAAAAAKAAKAAAAAAKAISNPDGTPLVIPDYVGTRTLKTETAAHRAALQAAGDLLLYPNSSYADAMRETIRLCAAALAHKRGTTPETEQDAILAKAQAKYDRETAAAK